MGEGKWFCAAGGGTCRETVWSRVCDSIEISRYKTHWLTKLFHQGQYSSGRLTQNNSPRAEASWGFRFREGIGTISQRRVQHMLAHAYALGLFCFHPSKVPLSHCCILPFTDSTQTSPLPCTTRWTSWRSTSGTFGLISCSSPVFTWMGNWSVGDEALKSAPHHLWLEQHCKGNNHFVSMLIDLLPHYKSEVTCEEGRRCTRNRCSRVHIRIYIKGLLSVPWYSKILGHSQCRTLSSLSLSHTHTPTHPLPSG